MDTVRLAIPSGFEVSSARVVAISGRANIINSPQLPGVTNTANVQVAWKYDMGGKVEYFICINAIARGLAASISNLVITPNPAIAGSAITGTANVRNSGSVPINSLTVSIQVKALTLEDVSPVILNSLPDDTRTQEVLNDTRSVNLLPGQQITEDLNLTIPNLQIAFQHLAILVQQVLIKYLQPYWQEVSN
ncbi:hypothetical protein [Leptothermofonsia sp. ETS-13]|uniref:hypothetical protein n=1 Tax=Leptothermofonsia sp. ETS-13 TaxID=3035696 RepID=UPI003BA240A0